MSDSRVSWFVDLLEMPLRVKRMWFLMADVSQVLNDVAETVRGSLFNSISALLAENTQLRGEDASESTAAENVRAAVSELGGLFASPELPDVPTTLPDAPVDDTSADDSEDPFV